MLHAVKIEPEYLNKIIKWKKSYEVRKNDRDYIAGDCIALNEYKHGEYTGRFALANIISVEKYSKYLTIFRKSQKFRGYIKNTECGIVSRSICRNIIRT